MDRMQTTGDDKPFAHPSPLARLAFWCRPGADVPRDDVYVVPSGLRYAGRATAFLAGSTTLLAVVELFVGLTGKPQAVFYALAAGVFGGVLWVIAAGLRDGRWWAAVACVVITAILIVGAVVFRDSSWWPFVGSYSVCTLWFVVPNWRNLR